MGGTHASLICLRNLTIDHTHAFPRRSTVPTPNEDAANIWALSTRTFGHLLWAVGHLQCSRYDGYPVSSPSCSSIHTFFVGLFGPSAVCATAMGRLFGTLRQHMACFRPFLSAIYPEYEHSGLDPRPENILLIVQFQVLCPHVGRAVPNGLKRLSPLPLETLCCFAKFNLIQYREGFWGSKGVELACPRLY